MIRTNTFDDTPYGVKECLRTESSHTFYHAMALDIARRGTLWLLYCKKEIHPLAIHAAVVFLIRDTLGTMIKTKRDGLQVRTRSR